MNDDIRLNPEMYIKTAIPMKVTRIGQVFFLRNGNRPAIVNAKIQMAHGIYPSGKVKLKTKWHYTYMKYSNWNMVYGGYIGKELGNKDIVEALYIGDKYEEPVKRFDEYGNYGENNPPVSSKGSWDSQDKTENLT